MDAARPTHFTKVLGDLENQADVKVLHLERVQDRGQNIALEVNVDDGTCKQSSIEVSDWRYLEPGHPVVHSPMTWRI